MPIKRNQYPQPLLMTLSEHRHAMAACWSMAVPQNASECQGFDSGPSLSMLIFQMININCVEQSGPVWQGSFWSSEPLWTYAMAAGNTE